MRVAITTNVLRTPPNYFVTEHAQHLSSRHQFRVFALLADVHDDAVTVPICDFVGLRSAPYGTRRWCAPFAAHRLRAAVVTFSPHVIHQHFGTWSAPAIAAASVLRVPLFVTLHGYDVRSLSAGGVHPMTRWHRKNVRAVAGAADRVLTVSRYLADEAIAGGFDASRVHVHYQGVDTDYFSPGVNERDATSAPVVAFVGSLERHKGVVELVEASAALAAEHEHRLVFAGGGSLEPSLRELARKHRHIEVLGRVARDDVRELMRSAAMLVLPSGPVRGGAEAAGLVLLEAQACGTPVIAFDVGGTSEMLRDNETGLLLSDTDGGALMAAMRELIEVSDAERDRLSARARDFVVTSRSVTRASEELDRHYSEVVS